MRTLIAVLLVAAAVLAAAPAARAHPAPPRIVHTPDYWDSPTAWFFPDGLPPTGELYPHDTWGTLFDVWLTMPGAITVLRSDVGVFGVRVDNQTLKLMGDSTLTVTAEVGVQPIGVIHGSGTILALGAWVSGTVTAKALGEDLSFVVDEIVLDGGRFSAVNHGRLTVQAQDITAYGGLMQASSNSLLSLSGHISGTGQILADLSSSLILDGADVNLTGPGNEVRVRGSSYADVRNSTLLTAVRVDQGSTMDVSDSQFYAPVVVEEGGGDPSHLSINQGSCRIGNLAVGDWCTVVVNPLARLEVDHMDLGADASCTVAGTIATYSPTSWTGYSASIALEGGRIEGGFTSNVPLYGWGQIATSAPGDGGPAPGDGGPGLTQQATVTAWGGVLELAPGATLDLQASYLFVDSGAEFYINQAHLNGNELFVEVAHEGTLRLNDAVITGWGEIHFGSGGGGGGPVPLGIAEGNGARLRATGDNHVEYTLYVDQDSDARILSGETRLQGLVNDGEVRVDAGAVLKITDVAWDEGGTYTFENYGDIDVAGMLDVSINMQATGWNDGRIEICGNGVFHLSGYLAGYGDIVVAENGVFHPHSASYMGGGYSIILEGGTLCGAIQTDHAIEGYGTITGSHVVIDGGIRNYNFGELLLITDAYIQFLAGQYGGGLTVGNGAILKIQDSGVVPAGDYEPRLGAGTMGGPEFWVCGFEGEPPTGFDDLTAAIIRDSWVMLPGHVERDGVLQTFGDVEMLGVDVHTDGRMNVFGNTSMAYLGVGIMHPWAGGEGGGEVYVAPGGKLTVAQVVTVAGYGEDPGRVRVEGELHFRPDAFDMGPPTPCSISGDGEIQLAGGVITGEAAVEHYGAFSIHGHGRIAAALSNHGTVVADTPGAWLRLDTNDKTNWEGGTIAAESTAKLAVEGIRLDNRGLIDIGEDAHLLVDAAIVDCQDTGTVDLAGSLELRRGGSIVNCGPSLTAGPGSVITVGAVGQVADPDVAYNQFALPAMNHAGTLTVFSPAATGQAAPDTGDTVLVLGGNFGNSGSVGVGAGSTMVATGTYTQTGGETVVNGLMVAAGGTVNIDGGALDIAATAGAALDLTDHNLIVNYTGQASPFAEILGWVASGLRDGPAHYWDGPGIGSSAAAAATLTAVGVIDNQDPEPGIGGLTELEGQPVDATAVLVKYTWWGDANLDGVVNSNDYDRIDSNWLFYGDGQGTPPGGFRWAVGDFNYDGLINSNDYDKIDTAWLLSGGAILAGGGGPTPTPEPATLALVALGGLALLTRRRRG